MAFAALVSLAQTINLILNYHQTSIPTPFRNQIKSIHKNASFLQAVLPDFPKTPSSLEHRIRDLAYKAEDVVEIVWSEKIRDSSKSKLKQANQNHENLRYDFPDLEKVTKEVESIVKEVRERHKEVVVGFDKESIEVKEKLLRDASNLEFVPIVGMPGIGKTTLAKYTYEDGLIKAYFDVTGWVRVSQHYNLDQIVSSLGASIGLSNAKIEIDDVFRKLFGRRYLIVLDDVWSVEAWYKLKRMFPQNGNKSRIIFTTRLLDLATSIASYGGWIHHMQLLNEISSWELLRNRIFGDKPCPSELEPIGSAVAASCNGLPLAIVVISGLLAVDQKTVAAWEKVAQDVKSAISENDSQFDKILSLSYTHLPHHLRPLFLYLGSFPQDYEMPVSKLIKLWVAEGFLKQSGSNKSLEEIAEDYLEDLVKRNLVSAAKRRPDGRIKRFGLHDLMREMCIRKAQEYNFFLHVRGSLDQGAKILRRVSVTNSDLDFLYGSAIHTVICLCDRQRGKECTFDNCRLLRILDLIDAQEYFHKSDSLSNSLPDHLFELFHLRYLALDYPFSIPAAISNLRNLQTLIIASDNHLKHVELPVEIWRLPQLRHILIASCVFPSEQGATIALENLQTLFKPVNFVCSEEILEKIPNLKKLGILYKGDDEKTYEKDYELQNLETLQTLENLKIEICNFHKEKPRLGPDFPKTLKNLTLSGVGLPWEDFKIVSSLPNLQVLKLRDDACIGETWKTTDGGFSQLEFLLIDQSHFENWITESSHFPRLKSLVLYHCWSLEEIPEGVGDITTLELIEVDDCNACLIESAKTMLSYLDDMYGDSMVRVRFVTG
ncbi:putative late blight resistance protein homolog R1A-10 [Salvia splendens]|uniref:putative late blight resistance protein homolog R1A-10 n=1 Tax=Salvia splendens TaxID=180675 RepID=UPI001C280AA6|nr:putative late blight resistance protein homolog R1A-10 [Salvia splendens]